MQKSIVWRVAAAAAAAGAENTSGAYSLVAAQARYFKWCMDQDIRVNGATVNLRPSDGRGLFATQAHRQGTTIVSVPLRNAFHAKGIEALPSTATARVPPQKVVNDVMLNNGVVDTYVALQMHLALLLAAERMDPDSHFAPYFDVLPHPAIDEALVAERHANVLDARQKLEYADHVRNYHALLVQCAERWDAAARPPVQVLDWAWRTVLQRQHLLPEHGAPPARMRRLGFVSWFLLRGDQSMFARVKSRLTGQDADPVLVPTLVPLLDTLAHGPTGNATVEVANRGDFGVCAEVQLLADVQKGEELLLTFSRAHSMPMTLYRFGFVPL